MRARVLYAPRNISGQATEYAAAIRPFGFDAEVWSYGPTAFGFEADLVVDPDQLLADPGYRWDLFDRAVRSFDIFHFQYSRSLLPPEGVVLPELWDIPLLKSLGKRVIMNFRGSDVRLPSGHVQREADSYLAHSSSTVDEARIRGRIAICRRFCDAMLVSTPGLLDDVPDAVWLPHVIDVVAWGRPTRTERDVPVVVHAPSSRGTKASDVVDSAMGELERKGIVQYRPLSGLDRAALREALQDADLVVDSLAIGDHGVISVEAMAAGAIPIAHISEDNRARNPNVPVIEATVHDLRDVVADLAAYPDKRRAIRRECAAFVVARHDRAVIGAELAEIYRTPVRPIKRAYLDWPRSDSQRRVEALESRIDELESDIDPLVRGLGRLTSTLPGRVTDGLLARIAELEQALAEEAPDAPVLRASRGSRRRPTSGRDFRESLKQNPQVHQTARKAKRFLSRRKSR